MTTENDEGRIAIDLKKRTITERMIIAESLIDSVIAESDQFREDTKKTDSEMNCDEWWKNYIRSRMSRDDVSDTNVGKTDFQPGDKFILELGQERRMFGEFEIKGTDLYVKTDLLEKLTRYEPEKFEIHNDHTDCIWYHYLDDDEPNACPSTCSQYRDGWNDAMKYIYCDGKGYRPFRRDKKYEG